MAHPNVVILAGPNGAGKTTVSKELLSAALGRRFRRGLHNFFHLYKPLADFWKLVDNSNPTKRRVIAESDGIMETLHDTEVWRQLRQEYCDVQG